MITCSPGPSYFNPSDLDSHNFMQPSDPVKAKEQHQSLIRTIEQTGTRVVNLQEMPGHPNSVFTKDTLVCTRQGYIRVRMGLPSRMGEESWMAGVIDRIGITVIGTIDAPGTVEGGDVIVGEETVFIGNSSRTNTAGIEQLAGYLKDLGYEVRLASVPEPFLHLGGAMTLVSPDTILCVEGIFLSSVHKGFHTIEVPNTGFISGNVIPLPNRQIIASKTNTLAADALRSHGYTVYMLDLSEFTKATGGPSCLIMEVK